MAYDPHSDQKIRGYSNIITSLFPEQTKTVPRIIVWSIIFLLDLILVFGGAFYFGLIPFEQFRTTDQRMFAGFLLLAVAVGIFWLQGYIWSTIMKLFR